MPFNKKKKKIRSRKKKKETPKKRTNLDAIPHHVNGDIHKGAGLHKAHSALEKEIHAAFFQVFVKGRVNKVDHVRLSFLQRSLDLVQILTDKVEGEPASAQAR